MWRTIIKEEKKETYIYFEAFIYWKWYSQNDIIDHFYSL